MDFHRQVEIKEEQVEIMHQFKELSERFADLNRELPEKERSGLIILSHVHRHEFEDVGVSGDHNRCIFACISDGDEATLISLLLGFLKNSKRNIGINIKAINIFNSMMIERAIKRFFKKNDADSDDDT